MTYYWDIETSPLPLEEIKSMMPEFNPDEVKLGNRKDPEVIKAHIESERIKHEENFISRAALSPITGYVIAIGWLREDGDEERIMMEGMFNEREMIQSFFDVYSSGLSQWLGFNVIRFDVPYLIRRAWHLGITVPKTLLDRYPKRITDIMQVWQCGDYKELISLDRLARFLKVGEKSIDGAQFAELKKTNPKAAREYLAHDLQLTRAVANRMGIRPDLGI